jgi:poly-gamma-glutamate synthesis protein (capsule biosynthesis protein)
LSSCSGSGPAGSNTAKPTPTPEPERKLVFNAVGDIMLSRGVANASDRAGRPDYPFTKLRDEFMAADFNFGNLESPISGNDKRIGKGLVFNARRDHASPLADYKFKVVNLANNHSMDQGMNGLLYTRTFLDEIGVKHTGTGSDLAEAWKPAVVEANGIRIAIVGASYASVNDGGVARNDYVARCEDVENLRKAIETARGMSDIVIATMHAGVEYVVKPDKTQVDFARNAIDAGADIVIGAHPHWIQTIEEYKGRKIYYSLGNFIFDQRKPETRTGLMLKITVKKGGALGSRAAIDSIEMLPVVIDDYSTPRLANPIESAAILKKIGVTETLARLTMPE